MSQITIIEESNPIVITDGDTVLEIGGDQPDIVFGETTLLPSSPDELVRVSADDLAAGYLEAKVVAGSGVTLNTLNPGANEQLEISTAGDVTLYVDPVGGNDSNDGTIGSPIQTLQEAQTRLSANGTNIIRLEDGQHVLPDTSGDDLTFASTKSVLIEGLNRTLVQAVTILSWSGRTATVSETLTVNALVDSFVFVDLGSIQLWFYVESNTAGTITFAISDPSVGGAINASAVIGTGAKNIESHSASIVTSTTSNDNIDVSGFVTLRNIFFDGSVNGGSTAIRGRNFGVFLTVEGCRFFDWTRAVDSYGDTRIRSTLIDGNGGGTGLSQGGGYLEIAQDSVLKDLQLGINLFAGGRGNHPSAVLLWDLGCQTFIQVEDGLFDDFSAAFYFAQPVDGGAYPTGNVFCLLKTSGSFYNRQNNEVIQQGSTALDAVFETQGVGTAGNLFDSPSATIVGSPAYVRANGTDISLATYNLNGSAVEDAFGSLFAR